MLESARPIGSIRETDEQRKDRVTRIKELVKSSRYHIDANSLAEAIFDWNPSRKQLEPPLNVILRRRTNMREYMRRRRADLKQSLLPNSSSETLSEVIQNIKVVA